MEWVSTAATGADLEGTLDRALEAARRDLGPAPADLAFVFVGPDLRDGADGVPRRAREALGGPHVLGCTAGGVIGGGREHEGVPAVSVLAGRLPGAAWQGFAAGPEDLPDPDAPPEAWHALVGVSPADAPSFVLLIDPFTLDANAFLAGLDYAYPGSVKVGGLASGARGPGEQRLFHGDRTLHAGAVGLALMGDVGLAPAVAQGCRPVGDPLRITSCDGHLLRSLDGRPVLEALALVLKAASDRDRALARTSLFLGFQTDPFSVDAEAPWLIRNILGMDRERTGLYVGEPLRPGRTVRFHVRDRETSAEDLAATLRGVTGPAPSAALLFSCLGRGEHLYGAPDHDSKAFHARFAGVPLGGFFCSGEIGPVGGTTHLHGYTSAFGLLAPRGAGPA
jgi:small ligand-binding sensory domain FIST